MRGQEGGGTRRVCQGPPPRGSRKQGTGQASGKRAQACSCPPTPPPAEPVLVSPSRSRAQQQVSVDRQEGVSTMIPATWPGHRQQGPLCLEPFPRSADQQQGTLRLPRSQHGPCRPPLLTLSSFPTCWGPSPSSGAPSQGSCLHLATHPSSSTWAAQGLRKWGSD